MAESDDTTVDLKGPHLSQTADASAPATRRSVSARRPGVRPKLGTFSATISPDTPFPAAPSGPEGSADATHLRETALPGIRRPLSVRQPEPAEDSGTSDLPQRLIAAGRELLREGGLTALTAREAARRCDVSHGAPRRYFPSQNAFLGAIAADISADLASLLYPHRSAPRELARAYLNFASRSPQEFGLLIRQDVVAVRPLGEKAKLPSVLTLWVAAYRNLYPRAEQHHIIAAWAGIQGLATLASHHALDTQTISIDSLLTIILRPPTAGNIR